MVILLVVLMLLPLMLFSYVFFGEFGMLMPTMNRTPKPLKPPKPPNLERRQLLFCKHSKKIYFTFYPQQTETHPLLFDDPLYMAARKIGGDFEILGYLKKNTFHAVEMILGTALPPSAPVQERMSELRERCFGIPGIVVDETKDGRIFTPTALCIKGVA